MTAAAWITAVTGLITALATAVLAVMAYRAWRKADESLRAMLAANQSAEAASKAAERASEAAEEANAQAREDSARQTRPYVFAEVVPGLGGRNSTDLRVTNAGRSNALDLTMEFDNWPSERDDIAESLQTMLSTRRTLPPGCSVRAMWRIWAEDGGQLTDPKTGQTMQEAGMPETGSITVQYSNDEGQEFVDTYQVLIKGYGFTPMPTGGPDPGRLQGDSKAFYGLGKAIAWHLGEMRR